MSLDPPRLLAAWERALGREPVERAVVLLDELVTDRSATGWDVDVGSRDVLLAGLLTDLAGDELPAVTDCSGCGELLEVSVRPAALAALPTHPYGEPLVVLVDGVQVRYRLPSSADLRAVAGLPVELARRALLVRCLVTDPPAPGPDDGAGLAAAVEQAMEAADPAGAVDLAVRCPGCDRETAVPVDVPALLWAEVESRALRLLADVHVLAAAYGWSEADVLALGPARGAAYLALVQG